MNIHMNALQATEVEGEMSLELLKKYIAFCRRLDPFQKYYLIAILKQIRVLCVAQFLGT